MKKANRYLKQVFIPSFWDRHILVKPENSFTEFSPLPLNINLDDIFILKEYRKIRNDHTFSYGDKFYLIKSKLKHSIAKQEIEIRSGFGTKMKAYFSGKRLRLSEVVEPTKLSMAELEIKMKLDAIELAETLQNVSEAARISGVSRLTIYKNRKLLRDKGAQALKRTFRNDLHHKNRDDKNLEKAVIGFSLKNPHLGQVQVCRQLK